MLSAANSMAILAMTTSERALTSVNIRDKEVVMVISSTFCGSLPTVGISASV